MIFDTDILIWIQRGNINAAHLLTQELTRKISIYTYMELIQTAPSKKHFSYIKIFLQDFNFEILPITNNIGHRAAIYIEEYTASSGLMAGDAIIASTAVENNLLLCTSNNKHFKNIRELQIKIFKP